LPWLTQAPPVVFSTNAWINRGTDMAFVRAQGNPYGINYRSTRLQERIKAVQLRCRFAPTLIADVTNQHVTMRFSSPEQLTVNQTVGTPLSASSVVSWRAADLSVNFPYYHTLWVPTDRWGHYTYQVFNQNFTNVTADIAIIQVGVEVE